MSKTIDPSGGLNMEPGASYSLADRFTCGICGKTPRLLSADGRDPIFVKLACCGKELQKSFSRRDLTFTQLVFDDASAD